jgi:hypothetical protein
VKILSAKMNLSSKSTRKKVSARENLRMINAQRFVMTQTNTRTVVAMSKKNIVRRTMNTTKKDSLMSLGTNILVNQSMNVSPNMWNVSHRNLKSVSAIGQGAVNNATVNQKR